MPTEQELNRAKELLAIEKQRAEVKEKQNRSLDNSYSIRAFLTDACPIIHPDLHKINAYGEYDTDDMAMVSYILTSNVWYTGMWCGRVQLLCRQIEQIR